MSAYRWNTTENASIDANNFNTLEIPDEARYFTFKKVNADLYITDPSTGITLEILNWDSRHITGIDRYYDYSTSSSSPSRIEYIDSESADLDNTTGYYTFASEADNTIIMTDLDHKDIHGMGGDDTLIWKEENWPGKHVHIYGDAGNDTISVSKGKRFFIYGGIGDDTISISDSHDAGNSYPGPTQIYGGEGNDVVTAINSDTLYIRGDIDKLDEDANDIIFGDDIISLINTNDSTVLADAGKDTIILNNSNNNEIYGGTDNDVIINIASNNNNIYAEKGSDVVTSIGSSDSQINAGDNTDVIHVLNGSNENIKADAGDDIITLYGGSVQTVSGGAGDDSYRFLSKFKVSTDIAIDQTDAKINDNDRLILSKVKSNNVEYYLNGSQLVIREKTTGGHISINGWDKCALNSIIFKDKAVSITDIKNAINQDIYMVYWRLGDTVELNNSNTSNVKKNVIIVGDDITKDSFDYKFDDQKGVLYLLDSAGGQLTISLPYTNKQLDYNLSLFSIGGESLSWEYLQMRAVELRATIIEATAGGTVFDCSTLDNNKHIAIKGLKMDIEDVIVSKDDLGNLVISNGSKSVVLQNLNQQSLSSQDRIRVELCDGAGEANIYTDGIYTDSGRVPERYIFADKSFDFTLTLGDSFDISKTIILDVSPLGDTLPCYVRDGIDLVISMANKNEVLGKFTLADYYTNPERYANIYGKDTSNYMAFKELLATTDFYNIAYPNGADCLTIDASTINKRKVEIAALGNDLSSFVAVKDGDALVLTSNDKTIRIENISHATFEKIASLNAEPQLLIDLYINAYDGYFVDADMDNMIFVYDYNKDTMTVTDNSNNISTVIKNWSTLGSYKLMIGTDGLEYNDITTLAGYGLIVKKTVDDKTIRGTESKDFISLTGVNNKVYAYDGDDLIVISGHDAYDNSINVISGGNGNDIYRIYSYLNRNVSFNIIQNDAADSDSDILELRHVYETNAFYQLAEEGDRRDLIITDTLNGGKVTIYDWKENLSTIMFSNKNISYSSIESLLNNDKSSNINLTYDELKLNDTSYGIYSNEEKIRNNTLLINNTEVSTTKSIYLAYSDENSDVSYNTICTKDDNGQQVINAPYIVAAYSKQGNVVGNCINLNCSGEIVSISCATSYYKNAMNNKIILDGNLSITNGITGAYCRTGWGVAFGNKIYIKGNVNVQGQSFVGWSDRTNNNLIRISDNATINEMYCGHSSESIYARGYDNIAIVENNACVTGLIDDVQYAYILDNANVRLVTANNLYISSTVGLRGVGTLGNDTFYVLSANNIISGSSGSDKYILDWKKCNNTTIYETFEDLNHDYNSITIINADISDMFFTKSIDNDIVICSKKDDTKITFSKGSTSHTSNSIGFISDNENIAYNINELYEKAIKDIYYSFCDSSLGLSSYQYSLTQTDINNIAIATCDIKEYLKDK